MRCRLVSIVCLVLLLTPTSPARAQQVVFLVRHAEKLDESKDPALFESADPPLSEAGRRRARALAGLLKDAGINAIYATEFQRTIKTAEPLAKALQIEIKVIPVQDRDTQVGLLRAQNRQDIVLIVGHSNTVPALLKALGHPVEIKIADSEYDNLFVVVPKGEGPPAVFRLRF